jgi:hypothetical protein
MIHTFTVPQDATHVTAPSANTVYRYTGADYRSRAP